MKPNTKIPCVFMRGGTSKALFFHEKDLPEDESLRDQIILSALGSPDVRQMLPGRGGHRLHVPSGEPRKLHRRQDDELREYIFGRGPLCH